MNNVGAFGRHDSRHPITWPAQEQGKITKAGVHFALCLFYGFIRNAMDAAAIYFHLFAENTCYSLQCRYNVLIESATKPEKK